MQTITPNLWFNGDADEAAEFYTSAFPNARVVGKAAYPTEGLADFQRDLAGKSLAIDLDLGGFVVTLINAGPEFPINASISFMLNFDSSSMDDARESLDRLWAALTNGGHERMPLQEYPYSPRYGWVQDRYGVNWQLMLTNPEGEKRPFVIPVLMFAGAAQNRAAEAREYYMSLFPGSRLGTLAEYPEPTGPALAGGVMFSDFLLADEWFAAMDSGVEQDVSFTEGVSLAVACADQAEIDRLWAALSAVPESEQCGWCKDRFGVSWQVVPANMAELMRRPGAYQKMMDMKKIEIAAF